MRTKKLFALLIIYTIFFGVAKGQGLYLDILGKDSAQTALIDSVSYQKVHASFMGLSKEVDSISRRFQKSGYVDLRIFPIEKSNDSLFTATFFLGEKYETLKIHFDELPVPEKLLRKFAFDLGPDYFSVRFEQAEEVLWFLNREIANRGRPFSSVQLRNIRKSRKGEIVAELGKAISEVRTIDKIIVKGYENFPKSYLKNFIGIKVGQPFNKEILENKMARLDNLPFAASIKLPEVQFTRDSTAVYLYMEKEQSNSFDGFLGFSNDQEDEKLQLTGNLDLLLRNNLNYGESLGIQYKSDGEEQVSFRADLELPYLFQSPVGIAMGLGIFRKDSSYTTVDQNVKLSYRFGPKINTYVGYRRVASNNLLEENLGGSLVEDYTTNYLDLGGSYKDYSKYSLLFPVKASFGVNFGYGTRELAGKQDTQFMGSATVGYIFQLDRRNSLFVYNESSFLSSSEPLENELFRFGGIHSLRGFAENSIFASLFSATQTEFRYLLSSNMYVHSIIDYAYYENKVFGLRENLYGIGFGIGLRSGVGILKLNFANGKADGQNFEFSNTKIHLSLTSKF